MQEKDSNTPGLSWSTPVSVSPANPLMPAAAAAAPASASAPAAQEKTIMHTQAPVYAGLLVGGIIVGVLLATAWSSAKNGGEDASRLLATSTSPAPASQKPAPSAAAKPTPAAAPVSVSDQQAGSNVAISRLNIASPTWVVVYVSREGKPGNALGARLFFAGDKGGEVALLRATQAGQNYFVGLSVDNGDRIFSLSADKPLADADGGPLWATFSAR